MLSINSSLYLPSNDNPFLEKSWFLNKSWLLFAYLRSFWGIFSLVNRGSHLSVVGGVKCLKLFIAVGGIFVPLFSSFR